MSSRYVAARTVGQIDISRELGWPLSKTARRIHTLEWLMGPFEVSHRKWNADVIGAIQALYGQVPATTRDERDFLSRYLKSKETS